MSDMPISSDEFRRNVEDAARILVAHGFQRAPRLDDDMSTLASVVYIGRNVAFTFTLDIRDQAVDLVVTRVRDGVLVPTWDGGYSSSLFAFLIKHHGFRGHRMSPTALPQGASKAKLAILPLVYLLAHPSSASLLADRPDALP